MIVIFLVESPLNYYTTDFFFFQEIYSLKKKSAIKNVSARKKIIKWRCLIHIVYSVYIPWCKNQWVIIPGTCPDVPLARCNTANKLRQNRHADIVDWYISKPKAIWLKKQFLTSWSWILNFSTQSQLAFENIGSVLHFVRGGLSRAIEWWKVRFIFGWDRFQSRDKARRHLLAFTAITNEEI